jgi:predicted metalloprotease with PDZ domain
VFDKDNYAKGALIALALDLTLRLETSGDCSLDPVMHALWQRYGKTGRGVPEDAVESLVQEVSGLELTGFFEQAVRGTVDLPLAQLLVQVGVELRLRPAKDAKDAGAAVDEFSEPKARRGLGLRLMKGGVGAVIAQVLDDGAAQQAGLAAGDTLVALNGLRVTAANLQQLLGRAPEAEPLELHVFRRDELMLFAPMVLPAPSDTCELRLLPEVEPAVEERRAAWLERGG